MRATVKEATITTKGQITIPKAVREQLGVGPGDKIAFVPEDGGFLIQKRIDDNPFAKWRGYLKHLAGHRTDDLIEEMRGR